MEAAPVNGTALVASSVPCRGEIVSFVLMLRLRAMRDVPVKLRRAELVASETSELSCGS